MINFIRGNRYPTSEWAKQTGSLTDGSRFKLHNRKWLGHGIKNQAVFCCFLRQTKPLLFPSPTSRNPYHLHRNVLN